MNPYIDHLYKIASRNERHIIGLMSGTSLDGLDIVYCRISGAGRNTKVVIEAFETMAYNDDVRMKINQVFAKSQVDFPYLAMLNEWIGTLHARFVLDFLEKYNIHKSAVDVIASHGQTVMHVPHHQHGNQDFSNATLQIGDGDHIAVHTGIITISDFRQKHVAAGGEGAPLAVYGDYLLFSLAGENRIMLNMEGIGNFTFLPADEDPKKVFVTDTGPCNTLMDAYMRKYFSLPYDIDGAIAATGEVHLGLLEALRDNYFFTMPYPKSTGPEVFHSHYVEDTLEKTSLTSLPQKDVMATLNMFSAMTIAEAIDAVADGKFCQLYMSGGGAHNPVLVATIRSLLPDCTLHLSDELGVAGDAKEAAAFALLANETLTGQAINFGTMQGIPNICMGKISFPG